MYIHTYIYRYIARYHTHTFSKYTLYQILYMLQILNLFKEPPKKALPMSSSNNGFLIGENEESSSANPKQSFSQHKYHLTYIIIIAI